MGGGRGHEEWKDGEWRSGIPKLWSRKRLVRFAWRGNPSTRMNGIWKQHESTMYAVFLPQKISSTAFAHLIPQNAAYKHTCTVVPSRDNRETNPMPIPPAQLAKTPAVVRMRTMR